MDQLPPNSVTLVCAKREFSQPPGARTSSPPRLSNTPHEPSSRERSGQDVEPFNLVLPRRLAFCPSSCLMSDTSTGVSSISRLQVPMLKAFLWHRPPSDDRSHSENKTMLFFHGTLSQMTTVVNRMNQTKQPAAARVVQGDPAHKGDPAQGQKTSKTPERRSARDL